MSQTPRENTIDTKKTTLHFSVEIGEQWRDKEGELWRVVDIVVEPSVGVLTKTIVKFERTVQRGAQIEDVVKGWTKTGDANA